MSCRLLSLSAAAGAQQTSINRREEARRRMGGDDENLEQHGMQQTRLLSRPLLAQHPRQLDAAQLIAPLGRRGEAGEQTGNQRLQRVEPVVSTRQVRVPRHGKEAGAQSSHFERADAVQLCSMLLL